MEFKDYESKPIVRKAYEITKEDFKHLVALPLNNKYELHGVVFVTWELIQAGDFIIYIKEDDIYHCSRKVFKERNIV